MIKAIIWKEWHENLWKLCFCSLASIAFTTILFRTRIIPDIANCLLISFVQMFAVTVIYSMDIFSGEMSNRTIYLLFKIPVHRWMIFFSKYLISIIGITLTFIITAILMELISQGRENGIYDLFKMNFRYCIVSIILFTWFCAFGCQSTGEAGSLVAMFGIIIGWGIILFWATICEIKWAAYFVPYVFIAETPFKVNMLIAGLLQALVITIVIVIACCRYAKIRRYL
jgi:ABC-type transport system involved in multi-copper enzyme maturation permease subunit